MCLLVCVLSLDQMSSEHFIDFVRTYHIASTQLYYEKQHSKNYR